MVAAVFTDDSGGYWLHGIRYLQVDEPSLAHEDLAAQLCRQVIAFLRAAGAARRSSSRPTASAASCPRCCAASWKPRGSRSGRDRAGQRHSARTSASWTPSTRCSPPARCARTPRSGTPRSSARCASGCPAAGARTTASMRSAAASSRSRCGSRVANPERHAAIGAAPRHFGPRHASNLEKARPFNGKPKHGHAALGYPSLPAGRLSPKAQSRPSPIIGETGSRSVSNSRRREARTVQLPRAARPRSSSTMLKPARRPAGNRKRGGHPSQPSCARTCRYFHRHRRLRVYRPATC